MRWDSITTYGPKSPLFSFRELLISERHSVIPSTIVALFFFTVYFLTLAPTVFSLDSAEFSAVAYNLGVPHATGYPLYILTGKLFTYLPVGDVGYRMNLMSAVFAAGALIVVYLLSFRVSKSHLLTTASVGCLAFSYYFWASAVVAEVYSMHVFLTITSTSLLLAWSRTSDKRLLYGATLVWGLSFGNHLSTVSLAPAFAYVFALGLYRRKLDYRHLTIAALIFISTLAVYIYLPLRYFAEATPYVISHYNAQGDLVRVNHASLDGMWQTLTARQFEDLFLAYGIWDFMSQIGRITYLLFANFLGIGFVLGMLGIVRNYTADRERMLVLALIFLTYLMLFASYGAPITSYGIPDKAFMILPLFAIWSVWIVEGSKYVLDLADKCHFKSILGRFSVSLARYNDWISWKHMALILPVIAWLTNIAYVDLSNDTQIRDQTESLLISLEPNALVFSRWPDEAPMTYLQIVEGIREDVKIIDRFLIFPENEERLIAASLPLRPVYVFGPLPFLNFEYDVVKVPGAQEGGHQLFLPK